MAFEAVPGVSNGELIRTTWGDAVANDITNELIRRDGAIAMTGDLTLRNVDPTAANHAVRKSYVDSKTVAIDGDTMTGRLIINSDIAQCLILRTQVTGGGGSFTDTPYLSFYDHTGAIHYGYVQGSAAGLVLVAATGDITLNAGGGQVRSADAVYATGGLRSFQTGQALALIGTGSNVHTDFYGGGSTIDSVGSLYGQVGYIATTDLLVKNAVSAGDLVLQTAGTSAVTFLPGGAERARINNSGQFFVGKTASDVGTEGIMLAPGGTAHISRGEAGGAVPLTLNYQGSVDGNYFVQFTRSESVVGRIEQTGTTGAAIVSGSDRRMKTIVKPIDDAVERVKALKPVRVTWNGDPGRGETDAFIADEVQPIVPEAVSGEPDAVDDEGNPVMQGMMYDKLITVTIAALQEALTMIDDLTARLEVLEAAS